MQRHRQLAAILFTDIIGYTSMMQKNELEAVAVIKHYNAVLEKAVSDNNGEILNNYGDGSLCTFPSAFQAVKCAVKLQQLLRELPKVPLRVGLHIGEIFFEDGKVLGDGVNVASRIQSMGQENTVLISGEVHDKIKNNPEHKTVSLGMFTFKNVDKPQEIYALANDGLYVPEKNKMAGKLERKNFNKKYLLAAYLTIAIVAASFAFYKHFLPATKFTGKEKSIAVLPFTNMSSDKNNEYFSDGITEEITTQLSKISDLKVIARTSSMQYKGSKKSIKEIAQELGVSAVLEGSVQKSENTLRITAQLIDANTQEHIWADKYDRELKDVFEIQSEVAQQIAHQLKVNLTRDEKEQLKKAPTDNLLAYEYFLQGKQAREKFLQTFDKNYFANAKLMLEKAISLDTNYALAYAGLASLYKIYTDEVEQDSTIISSQIQYINKAYHIAPDLEYVNSTRGAIFQTTLKNIEESYKSFRRAFHINPNNTNTLHDFAMLLDELGLTDQRITLLKKAIKLDPLNATYFGFLGGAEIHLNRLEDAMQNLQTALRLEPDMFYVIDRIAYIYALQNNQEEAQKWLKKFEKKLPPERADTFYRRYGQYSAYCYAKSGHKKKALELSQHWRVFLALAMKDEALQNIAMELDPSSRYNSYLKIQTHLPHEDYNIIRNDPIFLQLIDAQRKQYLINKTKYSIAIEK